MARRCVVIGLLGTTLDRGKKQSRWDRWRPTVSLFQQERFPIHRMELITQPKNAPLAEQIAKDATQVAEDSEVRVHEIPMADPWDFEEVFGALHSFARDYPFDTESEEYLIHISTGTHVAQICLFLLTESRHFPAKLVQTGPGRGGQPHLVSIIDLDLSRYDRIASRFVEERLDDLSYLKAGIATQSATFNALMDRIERVALRSDDPILLMGPTGAGKSALAKRIYELRRKKELVQGAFVEVNCATLRGDGAMSALFGHIRGAFTGAQRDRPGLLRSADGGVLFLDEIGELGVDEQAILLRAIEEGRFLPVGSDREVSSRFQLIAGTNRDLRQDVTEGRFREDLLARINLWSFTLPGLRERKEDIAPNLTYELSRFTERTGRRAAFNREAQERFLAFATSPGAEWRANFRDLNAAVTRMATLADGGRINTGLVTEEIGRLQDSWGGSDDASDLRPLLGEEGMARLDLFDRAQLEAVVQIVRKSRSLSEAGRALFAVSRTERKTVNDADRLRKYLARFGLTFQMIHGGED